MNNKCAIVTGASSGIGKSICIELVKNQFNVIMIARNKKKLQQVENEINSLGYNCSIIVADISKEKDISRINSQIKLLNIDVLINNAGVGVFNKIQDTSHEEWNNHIDINLTGTFMITKIIVNNMIKNKSGKIIFINSVAGLQAYPYSSAYVASKFGLTGFSSSLREELRSENIKVISVHPGSVDTSFWENSNADFPREEMLLPEEIASSIISAILAPNNLVYEKLVLRRTAGDF